MSPLTYTEDTRQNGGHLIQTPRSGGKDTLPPHQVTPLSDGDYKHKELLGGKTNPAGGLPHICGMDGPTLSYQSSTSLQEDMGPKTE